MSKIIDQLRQLNSKERFFLVGYALGNHNFTLSDDFRSILGKTFDIFLPSSLFCAMDYHLDWIYGALRLSNEASGLIVFPIEQDCINATNQDIDFLVAFDIGTTSHILLLEAKGVTGWTNEQMTAKARRLSAIFGTDGNRWPNVVPHFAIVSPRQPQRLDFKRWPRWMVPSGRIAWIELKGTEHCHYIHRSDTLGNKGIDGGHWTIALR